MNLTGPDIVAIGVFFAAAVFTAWLALNTKTFSEFSVANRSVPQSMVFASLAAAIVGPGFSVGFTAQGFTSGYAYYLLALTYAAQTIITGVYLAPRLHRFKNCHTLGEVMRDRYGKLAHILTGVVSVGLCVGFTAVMAKVGGLLLHRVIFPGRDASGASLVICTLVLTFVTASYTFFGGIRASIATDAMYFVVKSIIIPAMLIVAYLKSNDAIVATRAVADTVTSLRDMTPLAMFGIGLSFLLGEMLIPPFANRALAAESDRASRRGFVMAGLYCIPWLATVTALGVYAHQFIPASTPPDDAFIVLAQRLLPAGAFGLVLAALLAVIMSSQDSVMNAGAVALTRDLVGVYTPLSSKTSLVVGRIGTIAIATIAAFAAAAAPSIISGLLILYGIWAPTVLVPLLIGMFKTRTVPAAGWMAILTGGATSIVWKFALGEPRGLPTILIAAAASAAAYVLGSTFGRLPSAPVSQEVVS